MVKPRLVEPESPVVKAGANRSIPEAMSPENVWQLRTHATLTPREHPWVTRGKEANRAPTRTERHTSANAGSPTGRECAPRRARWYPWRSQGELRGGFLGPRLTFTPKGVRGPQHAENAVVNRRRVGGRAARPARYG